MSDEMNIPEDQADVGVPEFDEAAFLKVARRRSVVRTLVLATAVVAVAAVALLGGIVWWEHRLDDESTRIFGYYPWLIELTRPNAVSSAGPERFRSIFGSTDRYGVARAVGDVAVAADTVSVSYDVWGGETSPVPEGTGFYLGTRRFSGSQAAPDLSFFHPSGLEKAREGGDTEETAYLAQFDRETAASRERLAAMEPSCTAEMAVSFDRTMTLAELEAIVPEGVRLSWGALDVWPAGEAPVAAEAGRIVGAPFWFAAGPGPGPEGMSLAGVQDMTVQTLRIVAEKAPEGTATRCARSADFLEARGFKYYGVVVTGAPAALSRLAADERVTTVMTGLVVQPGE